jgi:hypothetical protein
MALTNFVDKVTRITAAWLNGVDQLVYGSGSQQGAGLLEYTQANVGVAPAGSVGAALDSLNAAGAVVPGLFLSTPAVGVSVTSALTVLSSGNTSYITTNNAPMSYNSGTGQFTLPAGVYLSTVWLLPGYASGTAAAWQIVFPAFGDGNNNQISPALYDNGVAAIAPSVQITFPGRLTSQKTFQLRALCSVTNTVAAGQCVVTILKLA